jgi:hypothetical protein
MRSWVCIALLLFVSAGARAEQGDGDAEVVRAGGAASIDLDDRRVVAIDRAFGEAIRKSVDKLVPPLVRGRHKADIRDKILRRARLYVARYQVRDEGDDGDEFRVVVDVWVAMGELRDALIGLGVELDEPPPKPAAGTRASARAGAAVRPRPRLVLLVVANVDGVGHATFGRQGGDGGEVGRALQRELGEYGFDVVGAAGAAVSVSETAGDSLPITDAAAEELARSVGAGGAVIVGAEVHADGKIRGTRLRGARGAASIRVVDTSESAVIGKASVYAAAYADSSSAAVDDSAGRLGRAALAAVAGEVERHWPAGAVTGAGVVVEITGAETWTPVRQVMAALKRAAGITAVQPRRFRRGYVALEVATELPAARVARAITAGKFQPATLEVRNVGDKKVKVEVSAPAEPEER